MGNGLLVEYITTRIIHAFTSFSTVQIYNVWSFMCMPVKHTLLLVGFSFAQRDLGKTNSCWVCQSEMKGYHFHCKQINLMWRVLIDILAQRSQPFRFGQKPPVFSEYFLPPLFFFFSPGFWKYSFWGDSLPFFFVFSAIFTLLAS